jgi:hypothetical protein
MMKEQWDENKKTQKMEVVKQGHKRCNKMKKNKTQSEEKWPQKVKGNMNPNGRNFLCWGAYGMASHGMLIAWFPWRWWCYSRLQIPQNMMTSGLRMWGRCGGEKGPRQIDPNVGVNSPWEWKGKVTRKGGGWRHAAVTAISLTFVLLLQGRNIVLDFDGAAWRALLENLYR